MSCAPAKMWFTSFESIKQSTNIWITSKGTTVQRFLTFKRFADASHWVDKNWYAEQIRFCRRWAGSTVSCLKQRKGAYVWRHYQIELFSNFVWKSYVALGVVSRKIRYGAYGVFVIQLKPPEAEEGDVCVAWLTPGIVLKLSSEELCGCRQRVGRWNMEQMTLLFVGQLKLPEAEKMGAFISWLIILKLHYLTNKS